MLFPLLWHPRSPLAGEVPPGHIYQIGVSDLAVEMYTPGRQSLGQVDRLISAKVRISEFGAGTAELVIPYDAGVMRSVYDGLTAYERECSGYGIVVWYNGVVVFDGVCYAFDDEDAEAGGSTLDDIPIDCTLHCMTWLDWFLGGRVIMGQSGNRYTQSSRRPDDIIKRAIRDNLTSGAITPSDYASVYDPVTGGTFSVSRANVGNGWSIAVAADTSSHPDTVTHNWDHGRSLGDNIRELCRRYNVGLSGSWAGTTYTLSTTYPAPGADKASTIVFDRENMGLRRFRRYVDRLAQNNVCEVRGRGRRIGQIRRYAGNSASYADVGLRETGETWHSADGTDAENDARYIIIQEAGAKTTHEVDIGEIDGIRYGVDVGIGDRVTVYDSRRGVTVQDHIRSVELSFTSPGPPQLKILLSREPENMDRRLARSGGGGIGAGRSGGHANDTGGEAGAADIEGLAIFREVRGQVGGPAVADAYNDTIDIVGLDTGDVLRARTHVEDGPEAVRIEIIASFTGSNDFSATRYFAVRGADGTVYYVPASHVAPG